MLNISQLLMPISPSQPCGEDLSFSAEIDAITEARRFDDPSLDQGEWVTQLKEADWPFVVERCTALIASKSKDLRLAVWLAEGGAKTSQFSGLGDGFQLIAGLCDAFWDDLYPLVEEGDQEQRIGNLSWLLKRSAQLVREMPLTEGKNSAFSFSDFESAKLRSSASEKSSYETQQGDGQTLAVMENARRRSSRRFYEKLLEDSKQCMASLEVLEKSVDRRLGMDGPGFSSAKEALDGVMRTISRFARDVGINAQAESSGAPAQDAETQPIEVKEEMVNRMAGPIQSRAQALNQLREVADFFRRTEPHSPVAYLADKAANWGELPLHDWLRTVIKDSASLAHVEELLGLQQQDSSAQE